ncbi:MAG: winged helix DNA-binding domain-containing protein [Candidatus Symbiothrix sp.]|jgi:hypothetical protein|nr:winged helix DNA-binding domain-containing protein [Candidatus Symbiothrix sp.]
MISIRLASHQLLNTTLQSPKAVVSWLGAIQAQDYNMAKWAVGIRLPESTDKAVEAAFNNGDFLRTHVLRPTWHFVSPENIRWMLALSAERIKSSSRARDRDLEITEELYSKTNHVIEKALEGNRQLTREDLGTELENAKIPVNSARLVHFMMRAEVEGIVCSGAMQGKAHTYTLLEERVPPVKSLSKEEALAKLAQIYFTSHCPATLSDFVWWSGLSQLEAKKGLEAVKSNFIPEEINGQTYWLADVFRNVPIADECVRLLPAFDEYIISYRDRRAVLPSENHSKAISSNGIFRPTILANGQIIGLWKKSTSKARPVGFDFFEQPDDATKSLADKAANDFKLFLEK